MDDHSVWRPLFGTLLAPVYWFTDDPTTVFHVALTLNALLGGIAAALLVSLARRLTPATPWWGAAIAVLVSLAPASVFSTDFVFSESLVAPLFLATLLGLLRLQQSPTLANGLVTALLAGAAFGAHSRMLPLTLITLGVIALAVVRRRMAVRHGIAGAAVAVAAVYAVSMYTAYVVDRLWDQPSTRNSIGGVREQLVSGVPVVVSALGQTWYLLVASLGVVVYGSVVLVRAALRRDLHRLGTGTSTRHPGRPASTPDSCCWSSERVGRCRSCSCRTAGEVISSSTAGTTMRSSCRSSWSGWLR